MINKFLTTLLCLAYVLTASAVIPQPNEIIATGNPSTFSLENATFQSKSEEGKRVAEFFNLPKGKKNSIKFIIDPKIENPEGYILDIGEKDATLKAATEAGFFYGMRTLEQLPKPLEQQTITDFPRFQYRGMHIDPCRHFLPVNEVKKHIDILSHLKINRLHFHLTEDQGWRIEIKKYPELTRKGATRVEGEGTVEKGYYTQDEIRDIVDYAAKRHITVVPEIELPGHELAAIAAYPWLSCQNDTLEQPRILWGVEDIVMCPGKETTFEFLNEVFDEVCELFPSEYIHIGGDECPKVSWKNCERCQKLMKEQNLKNEEELQAWVVSRMEKYLAEKGRRMIGWDEILEGGGSPNATIMSWRGIDGGIEAARTGRDAIMTPSGYMYLDQYQGDYRCEPVTIGGLTTLEKTYSFDPIPAELVNDDLGHHILGVQGNNWSEYMYTPELLDLRAYPRMLAVAEVGWTLPENKDYEDFEGRVDEFLPVLDTRNVNYFIPRPEQPGGSCNNVAFVDTTSVTFTTNRPLDIYYTWDGKEQLYTAPVPVDHSGEMTVWSKVKSGKCSPKRTIKFTKMPYTPAIAPDTGADTVYYQNMMLTLVPGNFLNVDDGFKEAKREEPIKVDRLFEIRNHNGCSGIIDAEIYVPQDGIYRFATLNEELWIDGQKIIDNRDQVKRYSHNDATVALKKGLHKFQTILLSHIIGGWPSRWGDGDVKCSLVK